jgi:hypothetical protein
MRRVCGLQFYSFRDILEKGGPLYPYFSERHYRVSIKDKVRVEVPELKHVALLEHADKRRAWIYKIDDKVFLIIYEVEPFNNHKQHYIVVKQWDDRILGPIEVGFVKLFENQVLTLHNEEWVSYFIGKLLNKDWLLRFPSGSQAKAG